MRKQLLPALIVALLAVLVVEMAAAERFFGRIACRRARSMSWHGVHYDAAYGQPVALIVPPTADAHTEWHWGVSGTRITPIYHQFRRGYPMVAADQPGPAFQPTPQWPSDTAQFGVYYVRGPW